MTSIVRRAIVSFLILLTLAFVTGCKSGAGPLVKSGDSSVAPPALLISQTQSDSKSMAVDLLSDSPVNEQADASEPELLAVSFGDAVDERVPAPDEDEQSGADATGAGDSDNEEPGATISGNEGVSEFGGLAGETLEEAWSVALGVDQSLEATRWNTSATQRGLFAAKSEYLPSVSARSTYNAMDQELALKNPLPIPGSPAGIQFSNREFVTAGVTVTQPIYTSGKITHAVNAAGAAVTASQTEEVTTALDIKLNVAEAYISVLRAQRGVEIAETTLKSLQEHERVVGRLVEQGVVVRNDLLAVRVQVADVRQALLATRNALDVARAAYNRALGRPLSSEVILQEIGERSEPSDIDALTSSALSQRPETAKISALVRSLRSQAEAVKSGNLPQFSVQGSYNFVENRFLVNEALTTVSIVGDWNFFDSGRNKHKSEQLMHTAEGLIRTRTDVETKIAFQVRQAWLTLQTAQKQVEVNREAIKSAEENLRVSSNRYQQGTVTNTVVLDAVTLRTGTYDRYHNSVYDVVLAWMQLRRAVGDL